MAKNIINATDENFDKEVLQSEKAVLVDFWARWCQPCLALAPIIEQIADEYKDILKVVKIDVDENPITANKYMITSIPTLILFNKGEAKTQIIGWKKKAELINLISPFLQSSTH